jgi:hypothetical protein
VAAIRSDFLAPLRASCSRGGSKIALYGLSNAAAAAALTTCSSASPNACASSVSARGDFESAQLAFSHLLRMRDYLATANLSLPANAQAFCALAVDVLGPMMAPGKYSNVGWCAAQALCPAQLACADTSCCPCAGQAVETAAQVQARLAQAKLDAIAVWRNNYSQAMSALDWDPQAAAQDAIAAGKEFIPGSNPELTNSIPLEAGRHRFVAFNLAFTFPVGPIPVTMEIELAGSWGLDAELQLEGSFEEDPFARAGAALVPGMDVQVLAFAGINLGFAQVGIGGELTLIEIGRDSVRLRLRRVHPSRPGPAAARGSPGHRRPGRQLVKTPPT